MEHRQIKGIVRQNCRGRKYECVNQSFLPTMKSVCSKTYYALLKIYVIQFKTELQHNVSVILARSNQCDNIMFLTKIFPCVN